MLNHYLKTKQRALDEMLTVRNRLEETSKVEQQKLTNLTEYQNSLKQQNKVTSSLSLQNTSQMLSIVSGIHQEQKTKVEQAQSDVERQHKACKTQASFNLGIGKLIEKENKKRAQKEKRKEQKQLDEVAMQLHFRNQS